MLTVPPLREMFGRLLHVEEQTRGARSVEYFGWLDMTLGAIILLAPDWTAAVLHVPALTPQAENYFRLVGLLVGGLGMLYVVAGRLNAQGFVFASLLDRPLVPAIMFVLWRTDILPGPLALAFSATDFGGFLWTLAARRADERRGASDAQAPLIATGLAELFSFTSGVVRNARTFHPDGRVFRATARSLQPSNAGLAGAAERLAGVVMLRIGMGVAKKTAPRWLADNIPDAPSVAMRFSTPSDGIAPELRRPTDLDVLCTAGGDRLWKLILNLSTGGWIYDLQKFDYFRNVYHADVQYRIDGVESNVWVRLVPDAGTKDLTASLPEDGAARERKLDQAVADHATFRLEVAPADGKRDEFVALVEIRLEEEINIDQEALHFDPVGAVRGFESLGFLTRLRKSVYPASSGSRPSTARERVQREHESLSHRLARYLGHGVPAQHAGPGETPARAAADTSRPRTIAAVIGLFVVLGLVALYAVVRFTRDRPVEYADDVMHFEYGSTGGEKMNGIPYWIWIALPEIFYDRLPDKTPGRGYRSFGLIYPKGTDPRYDLPVGASMRNFRGIDVVYLNCASCHSGTVRDAPGADARVVPGMPAHGFNLGAFAHFLTSIPTSARFTPQRILDQIQRMQDDPHRRIDKPDLLNRLIFRYYAVPLMSQRLLTFGDRLSFVRTDTWGPGRVDTFNTAKALVNFPMQLADPRELLGNVDFPSIWNQEPRKGMRLHWDGNNTSVDERNLSAAFGTGAYPPILDSTSVLRTAKWLETAQPPPYPYPTDEALVQQGEGVYKEYCVQCHGTREPPFRHDPPEPQELVGTVVPIEKIGTDRWRLDSYTWLLAVNQSTLYSGYEKDWGFDAPYPQRFSHFSKQPGYANMPLDGLWLRAPYLHNGSVPNLRELLEPASARSKVFYRGYDVYDRDGVGFVSNVPAEGGRSFFCFDTTLPGNGNAGHDGPIYGTELPAASKRALLEYLKTF